MNNSDIESYCQLEAATAKSLGEIVERLRLSARSSHRILKIARTIADLEGHSEIQRQDVMEAVAYRRMESCFTHAAQSIATSLSG